MMHKTLRYLWAVLLFLSAVPFLCIPVYAQPCSHDGDVNQDSRVTPADVLQAFKFFLALGSLNECGRDHTYRNLGGAITPADALCIFRYFVGLSSCLSELFNNRKWVVTRQDASIPEEPFVIIVDGM